MKYSSFPSSIALGTFLRTRREKLLPEAVGIVCHGRRRTPGLRREEVAQRSFVSTTWYTWLEQGRDISVSARTLSNIALALQCSPAEREYLFTLAELSDPLSKTVHCQDRSILQVVEHVQSPSYILDASWQVLAWNRPAENLFSGWLTDAISPNMLDFMFMSPLARQLVVDWPQRAMRIVAELRAESIHFTAHQPLAEKIDSLLSQSTEFFDWWQQQQVVQREGGERSFQHAEQGLVHFTQVSWQLARDQSIKMVTLIPQPTVDTVKP